MIEKGYKEEYDIKNMALQGFFTSANSQFSLFGKGFFVLFIFFAIPLFAAETPEGDIDITAVGMNMFTTAYKWESEAKGGYNTEALLGFTKKLNAELLSKKTIEGYRQLFEICECDAIVDEKFDEYISAHPRLDKTTGEMSYGAVIPTYLNPAFQGKSISPQSISLIEKLVQVMLASISEQVQEQMSAFQDISGVGLYMDGDVENSPYDLLDDIRRIDEIFFREVPEFGEYKNTNKDDVSALITGRVAKGEWSGGENYTLDLASDIIAALGGDKQNGSSQSATEGDDCEDGFCTTIEFITNTSYLLGPNSGVGRESFQGIYETALDWLTLKGDKINLACKSPPTINVWESENDFMLVLKKIFSGVSVTPVWKAPPFLDGFFDRDKQKSATSAAKVVSRQDKETEDSMRRVFKKYGIDYDRSTNLKSDIRKGYEDAAIRYATQGNTQAINAADGKRQGTAEYERSKISAGLGDDNKPFIKEKTVESVQHMEKTFDEHAARTQFLVQHLKDMNTVLKYLESKGYCGN